MKIVAFPIFLPFWWILSMTATPYTKPAAPVGPVAPELAVGVPSEQVPAHFSLADAKAEVNQYPTFSHDGAHLATIWPRNDQSTVFLWNIKEKKLEKTWDCPKMVSRVAFWKGRVLAGTSEGRIHAFPIKGVEKPQVIEIPDTKATDYGFPAMEVSADGSALAVARREIYVLKGLSGGRMTFSFPIQIQGIGWPRTVALSRDGSKILGVSVSEQLGLWDAKTGKPLWTLRHEGWTAHCLAPSPKGDLFVTGDYTSPNGDGWIRFWNAETGKEMRATKVSGGRVFQLCFSADGKFLFCTCAERPQSPSMILGWDVATGRQIVSFIADSRDALFLTTSPDGRWLASSGMTGPIRLFAMDDLIKKR